MRKIAVIICLTMMFSLILTGCGKEETVANPYTGATDTSSDQAAQTDGPLTTSDTDADQTDDTSDTDHILMQVRIIINGAEYTGIIPDTVCGRAFSEMLPFEVSGNRATDDVCCSVSGDIEYDESENESWNIGDFGWFGGWFTLLCDHEDNFSSMMVPVVCSLSEKDISAVTALTGSLSIQIEAEEKQADAVVSEEEENMNMTNQIVLTINGQELTATLADNSSAEALKELLTDGPLTISMRDYGNMEKVGDIGTSLPTNNEQITTEAGDLILYMGSAFVIYYAPNSWNFTRLGRINDISAQELKDIIGDGDVDVTLSLR